jgi:hypothetical protein
MLVGVVLTNKCGQKSEVLLCKQKWGRKRLHFHQLRVSALHLAEMGTKVTAQLHDLDSTRSMGSVRSICSDNSLCIFATSAVYQTAETKITSISVRRPRRKHFDLPMQHLATKAKALTSAGYLSLNLTIVPNASLFPFSGSLTGSLAIATNRSTEIHQAVPDC